MKKSDVNSTLEIMSLESADNQTELAEAVEEFLASIQEKKRSNCETYAETAERFRESGHKEAALVMQRAETLWYKVKN